MLARAVAAHQRAGGCGRADASRRATLKTITAATSHSGHVPVGEWLASLDTIRAERAVNAARAEPEIRRG